MSELVRIGRKTICHLSKLWEAKFFILCDVIFLVRLQEKFEIDHSWEWKDLYIPDGRPNDTRAITFQDWEAKRVSHLDEEQQQIIT